MHTTMPRKQPQMPGPFAAAPLADYFWIAGVDGVELYDKFRKLGEEYNYNHAIATNGSASNSSNSLSVDNTSLNNHRTSSLLQNPATDTIAEDADAEEQEGAKEDPATRALTARLSTLTARHVSPAREKQESFISSRSSSSERTAHYDRDNHSNRSSMTIKDRSFLGSPMLGCGNGGNSARTSFTGLSSNSPSFLNDDDFDKALFKFAADRESFLSDLSLSPPAPASVVMNKINTSSPSKQPPTPISRNSTVINGNHNGNGNATPRRPRPKTQRIVSDELTIANPLKSGIGSVRRHMSFRDMSSVKRQPSMARQASVRTSRRLSNYTSVIPVPQPLDPSPSMHPLKRKFEPALLDRYPSKDSDESKDPFETRIKFPDYVPMFAFPNDINIISSDQRPRSTWHGFAMTGGDGSKIYSVCVIMWIPLNAQAAEELEKRCEEWRRDNMTDEERELASSLGERLALERAKLSELLAQLPSVPQGSVQRDNLEDDISAVEEKIGLMADLLRPVRHAAASKIEGLTDGDTGFWIPRAYGIIGKDASLVPFWKEYLRALVVPMTEGAVLQVPPISPRAGRWMPLERYVVNLCTEACAPVESKTQVEVSIRELRLFARKEAKNELPGARSTDLYALFRALSIPNIMILFEYALAESRIIFLSSHNSMLHLASRALVDLMFPFQWTGVFIPVLPARLIQALEAPCPYIIGVDRRYSTDANKSSGNNTPTNGDCKNEQGQPQFQLPTDDFVLVDLDNDIIESTAGPSPLPRHQRRKLQSLLQAAAPLHSKFNVRPGPPAYAIETFPFDAFCVENPSILSSRAQSTYLAKLVGLNSTSFGQNTTSLAGAGPRNALEPSPVYNAFLNARTDVAFASATKNGSAVTPTNRSFYNNFRNYYGNGLYDHRPSTASSSRGGTPVNTSPVNWPQHSPKGQYAQAMAQQATRPLSNMLARNDSGFSLQASLREKRSGHFDSSSKRSGGNGSIGSNSGGAPSIPRRPSVPLLGHTSSLSVSSSLDTGSAYTPSVYAPSSIAASTIAASTIMAGTGGTGSIRSFSVGGRSHGGQGSGCICVEGHCLAPRPPSALDVQVPCSICDEKPDEPDFSPAVEKMYACTGCRTVVHDRCATQLSVVCPAAFHPEQIRAAFVRCFASLLYTYKKFMRVASGDKRRVGMNYSFNLEGWIKSLPAEHAEYIASTLQDTQAFNEFISEREHAPPGGGGGSGDNEKDPRITLFDEIILSKRNRGKTSIFSSRLVTSFLSDTSEHAWRTVQPATASGANITTPGLEHQIVNLSDGRIMDWKDLVTRVPAKLDPQLISNYSDPPEKPRRPSDQVRDKKSDGSKRHGFHSGIFKGSDKIFK